MGLRAALAAALLLALLGAGAGQAGDGHDHDRARQALEAGEMLPLRTILERVERDYPGQVMEVELERKDGRWIYEIKLLRTGGALVKLKIDARDGTHARQQGARSARIGTDRGASTLMRILVVEDEPTLADATGRGRCARPAMRSMWRTTASTPTSWATPSPSTPSCSTSACRRWTASRC